MLTLPYVQLTTISLGPLTLQVWGLLVACGILVSYAILYRLTRDNAQQWDLVSRVFFWVLLCSFAFARLFHIVLYDLPYYAAHPGEILAVWHGGFSSYGGFFGALVAFAVFYKKHARVAWAQLYDRCAVAFAWGWSIGRMGCFLIHDHPGQPCAWCPLGMVFPDGVRRPDLGLYDGLLTAGLGLFLFVGSKRTWFKNKGEMALWFILIYSISRFFLDFLRALPADIAGGDIRYAGLTPAQYFSVLAAGAAVYGMVRLRRKHFKHAE